MPGMIRRFWPAMTWAILILILTGVPGSYFPEVRSFWQWASPDKIVHLLIFGVQVFLIILGFKPQYLNSKQRFKFVIGATIITILYGLVTELLQSYVFIGRDGNIFDFLADAVGAFLGLLAYYLLKMKKILHQNIN
ncbi:MAG: VanZ family protein [Bacteroidetes bacterium CG18_big_fil_WC_8_21_14_2_50_41_14]|nr:MAG: VanZ family protein [Bacteroidetes bacterium CG18_big_fil_WC_8_21_14_2_50_41_14]PIY33413.1 MAG: VanZ family protein [Bacteroidetes bacterium CG_4_10_14_3_um_filter_42_6]PJB55811.1 MAG: VanZ family protein [Bacteroidetes bacterium CG_4_9_14_3_um_filter_41_19]